MNGASASATVSKLIEIGITDLVMIPDDGTKSLHSALESERSIRMFMPTREGEGIALAAGLWVGGRRPIVVLQNTGLMEAADTLRGCGIGPSIPLLLLVGWRGYSGAVAGKLPIDSAYPLTEPLLRAWDIPYERLMSDDDLDALERMAIKALETSKPAAVLSGYAFRP